MPPQSRAALTRRLVARPRSGCPLRPTWTASSRSRRARSRCWTGPAARQHFRRAPLGSLTVTRIRRTTNKVFKVVREGQVQTPLSPAGQRASGECCKMTGRAGPAGAGAGGLCAQDSPRQLPGGGHRQRHRYPRAAAPPPDRVRRARAPSRLALSHPPPPLSLSLTLTHSFSHSLTQSLSLTHTHTRSLSLSL